MAASAIRQHRFDPDRWFDAYRKAIQIVAQQPVTLNHNELSFQQVGWTGADVPRLVVFDLETMALLPHYSDIAGILAPLAAQTGRSQQDLFDTYLDVLAGHTDEAIDQPAAWSSMLVVRIKRTFEALPWLLANTGTPGVGEPDQAIAKLHRDLTDSTIS